MNPTIVSQSPFAAVTFVAAPALLTNASSVLAMSTINRMLRTRDRMSELFRMSEAGDPTIKDPKWFVAIVGRVERQAELLMRALRAIYIALAAFACATLVTLLGVCVGAFQVEFWLYVMAWGGLLLGLTGVGGLVAGCANLFRATQLSLLTIQDEAAMVRKRQAPGTTEAGK